MLFVTTVKIFTFMPMITVAMYNDKLIWQKRQVDEAITEDVSKDVKSFKKRSFLCSIEQLVYLIFNIAINSSNYSCIIII